jgi:hypothetical protein
MISMYKKIKRKIYARNKLMNSQLIRMDLMESLSNLKELEIFKFSIKLSKNNSCNEFIIKLMNIFKINISKI